MKLHPSTSIVLGFLWLHSTNPHIDWPSLTLHFNWDNSTNSRLVPFDVSLPSKNSETAIDQPQTPPQLCLSLPKVLPALIDNSASSTFVAVKSTSDAMTSTNPLSSNSSMEAPPQQGSLNTTMIPSSSTMTYIVLGLLWLQDVNPDIDWKNLTMQFPGPEASLAAAIPLHLQSISDSNISNPSASTSGAT
ncbi:hypothetical protein E4T56_gene1016 [Termitomyces sp. T112]|nr:hypothetical protein E4T56_gene1016 [Termitomyces sp. T112]